MQTSATRLDTNHIPDRQPDLQVTVVRPGTAPQRMHALLLQQSERSIQIQISALLLPQDSLELAADPDAYFDQRPLLGRYRVLACNLIHEGRYLATLAPVTRAESDPAMPAFQEAEGINLYEILQVSRQADFDTIRRVFHILAQRYHPDNAETGSELRFRQVVTAHAVLSDPERRAAYDVSLADEDKTRHRIFDSLESSLGVQAEIRKREGVLRLLYTRRLTEPNSPGLTGRDLAEMLGCPNEHLQFAFWMLSEQKFVRRSDNNSFEITFLGAEAFEAEQANYNKPQVPRLPSPV
ncbi:MAG: J domain-containing protein [Acidobacteriota bacterium]|nr:J domain-containing protein [Acidobacteriota bacterium]